VRQDSEDLLAEMLPEAVDSPRSGGALRNESSGELRGSRNRAGSACVKGKWIAQRERDVGMRRRASTNMAGEAQKWSRGRNKAGTNY
jgi:hypothetical protein